MGNGCGDCGWEMMRGSWKWFYISWLLSIRDFTPRPSIIALYGCVCFTAPCYVRVWWGAWCSGSTSQRSLARDLSWSRSRSSSRSGSSVSELWDSGKWNVKLAKREKSNGQTSKGRSHQMFNEGYIPTLRNLILVIKCWMQDILSKIRFKLSNVEWSIYLYFQKFDLIIL